MNSDLHEIAALLNSSREGNREASEWVFQALYPQLRQVAASYLRQERDSDTLNPTVLVAEFFLRNPLQLQIQNRTHFLSIAAQIMRRIVVDHARSRSSLKRGGQEKRTDPSEVFSDNQLEHVIEMDQALEELQQLDPRAAKIVELRVFGELTLEETAEALGISARTAKRDWTVARAWLAHRLAQVSGSSEL